MLRAVGRATSRLDLPPPAALTGEWFGALAVIAPSVSIQPVSGDDVFSDEFIIAAGSDNSGQPESTPGAVPSSPRKEMLGSGSAPAGAKGTRDNEISEPTMETLNGVGREAGEMLGAAGGHRIDRPQTQPARLQPSTRLAAKSHACQRIPVYFPVCFQSLIRPMAKS